MTRTQRQTRVALIALALLSLLTPSISQAEPRLHGVGSMSLGVSDNPQAVPDDPPPGVARPVTAVFTDIRPGILVLMETPAVSHKLRLTNTTTLFFGEMKANSYANAAEWNGMFTLGRRATLVAGASVTQGRTNTFSTLNASQNTQVTAQQSGGTSFIAPAVQQGLSLDISPFWRATETFGAGFYTPAFGSDGARTGQTSLQLAVERVFKFDAVGLQGSIGYADSNATTPSGRPAQPQLIAGAVARWRHDWTQTVTTQLDGGWITAMRANDTSKKISGFNGLAAIRYTTERGNAELSGARTITPNLLIGQLLYGTNIGLRGSMPLWRESRWLASASVGYQWNSIIDTDLNVEGAKLNVFVADASLTYAPDQSLLLSARYQHFNQDSEVSVDTLRMFPFNRNVYMVTGTIIFPPLPEVRTTFELSNRVDQADGGGSRDGRDMNDGGGDD